MVTFQNIFSKKKNKFIFMSRLLLEKVCHFSNLHEPLPVKNTFEKKNENTYNLSYNLLIK